MDGIKSKERVKKHGEVFTPDSIVNDMLDLVDNKLNKDDLWKYIDTTYLEPSCGNGNFLVRILDRKLNAVQKLPKEQRELGLIRALSSIYAIDIQGDNVSESKKRIINLIESGTTDLLELSTEEKIKFNFEKMQLSNKIREIVNKILDNNILEGNGITGMKYKDGVEQVSPLVITEYIWDNSKVTMILHEFNNLDINLSKFENIEYTSLMDYNTEYSDEANMDDF